MSSVYDPDGRGCAFTLPGKKVLQEITGERKDWDDDVCDSHKKRWNEWKTDMMLLKDIEIPRCYTPDDFWGTCVAKPPLFL